MLHLRSPILTRAAGLLLLLSFARIAAAQGGGDLPWPPPDAHASSLFDEVRRARDGVVQVELTLTKDSDEYEAAHGQAEGKVRDTEAAYRAYCEPLKQKSMKIEVLVEAAGYESKSGHLSFPVGKPHYELTGRITGPGNTSIPGATVTAVQTNTLFGGDKKPQRSNFGIDLSAENGSYRIRRRSWLEGETHHAQLSFTLRPTTAAGLPPEVKVSWEENPVTGEPFYGVVADGLSTLTLKLEGPSGTTVILTPALGTLTPPEGERAREVTIRLGTSPAQLGYHPPETFPEETKFTEGIKLGEDYAPAATEIIALQATAPGRGTATSKTEIRVLRTPVVLVHGFSGDRETWRDLAYFLGGKKFFTFRGLYYSLDESIPAQAVKLAQDLDELRITFGKGNLRLGRVDLVAHSMGGLISRYYIGGTSQRPGGLQPAQQGKAAADVRKLIMVATPNHGVSYEDFEFGYLAARFYGHKIAARQLYAGGNFIKGINRGEATGDHLNPDVEYAVLIGRRHRYPGEGKSAVQGAFFSHDDGVVYTDSARLNGIHTEIFKGMIHSPDPILSTVYGKDESVLTSEIIFKRVLYLLQHPIQPSALSSASLLLFNDQGSVWVHPTRDTRAEVVPPMPATIGYHETLVTGPKSAATLEVHLGREHWATVFLAAQTELTVEFLSPSHGRFFLRRGKARFRSRQSQGRHVVYDVLLGGAPPEGKTIEVTPAARLRTFDTDVVAAAGALPTVASLEGRILVEALGPDRKLGDQTTLGTGIATQLSASGLFSPIDPPSPWWTSPLYAAHDENYGGDSLPPPVVASGDSEGMDPYWGVEDTNPAAHLLLGYLEWVDDPELALWLLVAAGLIFLGVCWRIFRALRR